jgi:hypothetical protein
MRTKIEYTFGLACSSRVRYIVGSSPDRVKSKTIKLVSVASPLRTQQKRERTKTGGLGISIMCPIGRHVYSRTVVSVS